MPIPKNELDLYEMMSGYTKKVENSWDDNDYSNALVKLFLGEEKDQ